jgi:hypothetical protein
VESRFCCYSLVTVSYLNFKDNKKKSKITYFEFEYLKNESYFKRFNYDCILSMMLLELFFKVFFILKCIKIIFILFLKILFLISGH